MTTQSVPSHTRIAHAPAVAARMAVPAVLVVLGFTLEPAETTVYVADRFLMTKIRPVLAEAVGKVTVTLADAPLAIMKFSVSPRVNDAVLVTGAFSLSWVAERTVNAPVAAPALPIGVESI